MKNLITVVNYCLHKYNKHIDMARLTYKYDVI